MTHSGEDDQLYQKTRRRFAIPKLSADRLWWLFLLFIVPAITLYFVGLRHNPPGFFLDESSIAFNAHTIAQSGRDEYGMPWPLYFRAFGEFKNPVYIYCLAALFRLTGPSILVARLFSATAGVATALSLGLLGARLSDRRTVGLFVAVSALLTPWLFELSRVVLEVSLYPLVLALFLLCLHSATARRTKWSWRDVLSLASTLSLLTYTYSIGRLHAPLLALGLLLFIRRVGWKSVGFAWALYAVTLVPLIVFNLRNPGALTARFSLITYLKPQNTFSKAASGFLRHYAANINPWRLLVTGDPNYYQVIHLNGAELVLAATFLLSVAGAWCIVRGPRLEGWWMFVLYGLAISIVPASLTDEPFHILHLAPVPVFLIILSVPAVSWLVAERTARRVALITVLVALIVQGGLFHWRYAASAKSASTVHIFDADYPSAIFAPAIAHRSRPIYLSDAPGIPGYIQAYWYATLQRIPLSTFVHLSLEETPPPDAPVIATKSTCMNCTILAESPPYTLYIATPAAKARTQLPESAFRAQLSLLAPPTVLRVDAQATVRVRIKNMSDVLWPGRRWNAEMFQVSVGNHWLDRNGKIIVNDDGRAPLTRVLRPGDEVEISLNINAPHQAGDYLLELDMLQEGVSWFGLKGSPTVRQPLRIE